jgi:alpha-mannosidase
MPMHWREPSPGRMGARELVPGAVVGRAGIHLAPQVLEQPFELVDTVTGRRVPAQVVRLDDPLAARPLAAHRWALGQVEQNNPEVILQHGGHLLELVFLAEDVPSLGYKVYRLAPDEQAAARRAHQSSLRLGENWLENQFYRLEIDPQSGCIASLYDKTMRREWVDKDAPHGFNQLLVRDPQTGAVSKPEQAAIQPGETGALCASLVVKARARGCPQITQEITLYDGIRRIDFANRLLKDATPLLELYFAFPFDVENPRFHLETSNAVIEPVRDQLPGSNTDAYTVQHWVSVCGGQGGVAWSSLDAPVVTVGGLWQGYVSQAHHGITPPGYGHEFLRDPSQLTQGHLYSYVMNNNFRTNFDLVQAADVLFRYSLTSFDGDWREGNAPGFGWGAANPLETVCLNQPQEGVLGLTGSFLTLDQENVQLLTLKRAEDGDGLILRFAELAGLASRVAVALPLVQLKEVVLCSLVEHDLENLAHEPHGFGFEISAYGLATVRCRLS